MIIKQNGRYLIAFDEGDSLTRVTEMANSLIGLIQETQELYPERKETFFALEMLKNMLLSPEQMRLIEKENVNHVFEIHKN